MLCCDTAAPGAQGFEELAVFVSQLASLGVDVRVHVGSVPEGLNRNAQFDLAPHLFDGALGPQDRVVLLGAQRLTDGKLAALRRLAGSGRPCLAFGSFDTPQSAIGTRARLSYVFGQNPQVFDLGQVGGTGLAPGRDCPVFGLDRHARPASVPRLLIAGADLSDPRQAGALSALALSRRHALSVIGDGKAKQAWVAAHGPEIAFWQYGEVLPASLAERVDVCVIAAPLENNYRLQCLVANLAVSGAALIDALPRHPLARGCDAFLRGPLDLAGLAGFLASDILPNLGEIAAQARASRAASGFAAASVLRFLGVEPGPRPRASVAGPSGIVFMPTNGVGLGHAQRCALIARELDRTRASPVFAAFPSCTRLIKSFGFDVMPMIGRSGFHAQTHENDLANHLRLRALSAGARTLVFDGGYVFDSVCRTILDNRLTGVWIRRGLWQAGQNNAVALDREKVFDRVIVPREAFDEINAAYSRGDHLREVGPIVQRLGVGPERRQGLRDRLAARFAPGFTRLVVSLLGAGVAADRGAQIQALCGMMERRADTLHLIVVWPTAVQQPGWFDWQHSRVVRTRHAGMLAAASDLCISAAGYNSFHETLYNRIPTIFIPQMGSFMDDQRARAIAARDRGLAGLVESLELMALEREIGRFLDAGEAALVRERIAAFELPDPGNAAAARLIEEVSDGRRTLGDDLVADRAAGGR